MASGGTLVGVARTTTNETAGLLAGGSKTASLTVLVDGGDDPVDAGITADGGVRGVDKDYLVVLVGGILVDPVRVEDTEVTADATNLGLSDGAEGLLVLQLENTLGGGLTVNDTLLHLSLAATSANADAVDDVTLLALVAETTGLLGASGADDAVNTRKLTVHC
jgi:hypothetical protein